ncbi:GH36-type glycosyl hydrolase domain-containing protein [Agarivorans gilvus]|uniref:Glycosyl transferase n=1 Tax=Agarivorans gilvus TaxID=680279 RepID=A0ABQ1I3B6_9ALTE|nr:glycosyl hydrolase family 65 protein [Agarivorans gilvus]GGB12598.1 glycosyl transferase [Agarivorans gilvus]
MSKQYGYFDDQNKEYVLTTPKTPIKWANYVGTLDFGGIIDTTGGTLVCKQDPALNRITKYIAQQPQSDFKGSSIYVRRKTEQGYQLFSPFFTPCLTEPDEFECRIGLSYTRWRVVAEGLEIDIKVFVPKGSTTLLQDIKVTNVSSQSQQVDLAPVYEFTHFDALKQLVNADWVPQTMTLKAHPEATGHLVLEQYAFMKRDIAVNYVSCNLPVDSWEGDRRAFLGENEFGSWAKPLSLMEDSLSNSECDRGDNVAAMLIKLGELAPGQSQRVITQLGQADSLQDAADSIALYRDEKAADQAFAELATFWEDYLQVMQVDTPDSAMNSMLNVHNPRQCHTTKNWSRYLSLYQLGYGARGIGFRDSSQDLIGVMAHMPEEAREFAERLLSVQLENGSAMHQYFPLTMEANEGDSREEPDCPDYYGDDHLWIVLTVAQYLKETGDLEFLNKPISYYSKTLELAERPTASVYQHLLKAVDFTWNNVGQHGLPLLGFADWNDTVNLPTGAESLFVANLFGKALKELLDIAQALEDQTTVELLTGYYQEMKQRVNQHAWDGEWWVRYFTEQGEPIGSHKNSHGSLYTNGQSWPVISGFAEGDRMLAGLDAVNNKLNTQYGIMLSGPGYNGYDHKLGGVSTYPPGAKENGGIFLHSNPWVMMAETIAGNGDRAFEYYNQINPAFHNDNLDVFQSEPYCYPQNILGKEHKQFGMGRNAWLSGTSSWTYVAGTQYILGIKPGLKGLEIDPCIPKAWPEYSVRRRYRGATYNIKVSNPKGVSKGVASITLNGKAIEGQVLPIMAEGEHQVEVVLG